MIPRLGKNIFRSHKGADNNILVVVADSDNTFTIVGKFEGDEEGFNAMVRAAVEDATSVGMSITREFILGLDELETSEDVLDSLIDKGINTYRKHNEGKLLRFD